MTNPIKDNGNGNYLIRKGFIYAAATFVFFLIAASWSLTWSASADRTMMFETLKSIDKQIRLHGGNMYIHNLNDSYVKKTDLTLYFAPMLQRLKTIEEDISEIKIEIKTKK